VLQLWGAGTSWEQGPVAIQGCGVGTVGNSSGGAHALSVERFVKRHDGAPGRRLVANPRVELGQEQDAAERFGHNRRLHELQKLVVGAELEVGQEAQLGGERATLFKPRGGRCCLELGLAPPTPPTACGRHGLLTGDRGVPSCFGLLLALLRAFSGGKSTKLT